MVRLSATGSSVVATIIYMEVLRNSTGMSQKIFASYMGVSEKTEDFLLCQNFNKEAE